jgi:hypothetical protein
VHDAEHVGAQRAAGVEEGVLRVRLAREVQHPVGRDRVHQGLRRRGVVEVGLQHLHADTGAPGDAALGQHHPEDLDSGLLGPQVPDQVAAHEAAGARDEQPQR